MRKIKESTILKIVEDILKEKKPKPVWVKISAEDFIRHLEHLEYSIEAFSHLPRFRGKKVWVVGDVDLSGKPVDTLGNLGYVEGKLDIDNTSIKDIPKGFKVQGRFSYHDTGYERKLEKIRIREELAKANERRKNNEWSLENGDEEGLRAQALFKYLVESKNLDPTTADVYNLIPYSKHYDLQTFKIYEVDDFSIHDEWSVGTESEADSSLGDYVDGIIDDAANMIGNDRIEWYIDDDKVEEMAREDYENVVRDEPDNYMDESLKQLSDDQTEEITQLHTEKEQLYISLANDPSNDEMRNRVDEIDSEIEDIKENPDGDYSDEDIEEKIDELVEDATKNSYRYLRDLGYEGEALHDFLDMDKLRRDIEGDEDYGSLNSYDGTYEEVRLDGELYIVMRTN